MTFDCVNHKILLTKREFYGITENHYKFYKSYLMDRYQRTMLCNENGRNTSSTWSNVEQGVPQGSVFGPLLFLMLINYLPTFINDKSVPIYLQMTIAFYNPTRILWPFIKLLMLISNSKSPF